MKLTDVKLYLGSVAVSKVCIGSNEVYNDIDQPSTEIEYCPNCGYELVDGVCPNAICEMSPYYQPPIVEQICPQCGTIMNDGLCPNINCPNCPDYVEPTWIMIDGADVCLNPNQTFAEQGYTTLYDPAGALIDINEYPNGEWCCGERHVFLATSYSPITIYVYPRGDTSQSYPITANANVTIGGQCLPITADEDGEQYVDEELPIAGNTYYNANLCPECHSIMWNGRCSNVNCWQCPDYSGDGQL